MSLKRLCVLGSTGSIGKQTLDIAARHPEFYQIVSLSTHQNIELLEQQMQRFNPLVVAVTDESSAQVLESRTEEKTSVLSGKDSLVELVESSNVDIVVNALVGSLGLDSTIAAIRAEKTIALANKESMVVGGGVVRKELREFRASIIPVDSEHNAIFQCLVGEDPKDLKRILLTGSGGPFRGRESKDLEHVTIAEALAHPRWTMGKKISIDSATLMNKGLEVIEAHFLFGVGYDQIEVVIHPQSIIHSMVEFVDGSIKAHLGPTDMRIPIQYAISFPERLEAPLSSIDFVELSSLTFEAPDLDNFPCLRYAFEAGRKGKTFPAVLNAANEEAVSAFLNEEITFTAIPKVIDGVLNSHEPLEPENIEVLKEAEQWARRKARELIKSSWAY